MSRETYVKFLGELVEIGIPHWSEPRPFYITGTVVEVNEEYLVLDYCKGARQIKFLDIVDIHIKEESF